MAKSNLYTRSGDAGTTSLVGGQRISKASQRLDSYGTLDEFSSHLGLLHSRPDVTDEIKKQLLRIQNLLFNLGAYLATLPEEGNEPKVAGLMQADIEALEKWIDTLDEATPKMRVFVLPGGTESASVAHIARTVCRRAEREILALAREEYVDPMLIAYVNRLSDYLFIVARYLNHAAGVEEITWKP